MVRQWITGVLSLTLLVSSAYAQTQIQPQSQPTQGTANVAPSQVLLPPLPNTTTSTEQSAAHNTGIDKTVNHLLHPQAQHLPGNSQQPKITPTQALNDPKTEEHYFEESTYGTAKDPAFENMLKKMYPMSPEQIQALREAHETTQRAMEAPAQPVPKPTVTSQSVNLSPGSAPPVLRLSTGYVSSVVFMDETGAPWPVSAYSIGDPNNFNIQWDQQSNLLLIQGQKPYATGNMAVNLLGMPTPVMLTIVTDQGVVDYRVDFRIQGKGPNARGAIIGSALPQNANAMLMNLLEGIAPQDSELLNVTGGNAQAWLWNNQLYVRTPLTLLSPGWVATMSSADGTHVYQLPVTPMILASYRGESITLKVEGL
jgi:intracellular multiplication protein IcmK